MATIIVKNISNDLYAQLKSIAKTNRRSVNNEVIVCIERRLSSYRPATDEIIRQASRLREITAAYPITDENFNEAKSAGRP